MLFSSLFSHSCTQLHHSSHRSHNHKLAVFYFYLPCCFSHRSRYHSSLSGPPPHLLSQPLSARSALTSLFSLPLLESWGVLPVLLGLGPPCRPALFILDLTTKANSGWRESLYFGFLSAETVSLWIVYTISVGFGTLNRTWYLLNPVGDPMISVL